MTARAGFTLLEALLVLAIIGIVAGAGYLSLRPALQRVQVEGAATAAQATIRLAMMETRRRNAPVALTLSGPVLTLWQGGTALRRTTLTAAPTASCRETQPCPDELVFAAPFGRSATEFSLHFAAGRVSRTLWVRGPAALMELR